MSSVTQKDFSTDKNGNAVGYDLQKLCDILANRTECRDIYIHNSRSGHFGYLSKRSGIGQTVLDFIRDYGWEVVVFRSRAGRGYLEARPKEREEL